jgi:hypothetical protein
LEAKLPAFCGDLGIIRGAGWGAAAPVSAGATFVRPV